MGRKWVTCTPPNHKGGTPIPSNTSRKVEPGGLHGPRMLTPWEERKMKTNKKAKPRIIILGGGFGGLEAALSMRSGMPDEADITLVSDKEYFNYKPNTIYVPFGLSPGKLVLQLSAPTRHRNISLIKATAREIDPV